MNRTNPGTHSLPIIILCLGLLLSRCANPVTPSGGPKDTEPPVNEACFPPGLTVNFDSKMIRMDFDEFFQVKDASSQVMISPPWLPETEYRTRSKSLFVILNDSLIPNTTYTLNFGDAISDISEGNILRNFKYVFSTGPFVDSMSMSGNVKDAFSLLPEKDILVMLYLDNNDTVPFDSLPYKVKPFYVTRTDDDGNFQFTNLSDTSFKLFALKDLNNNLIYDLPDEQIAFLDSLAKGVFIPLPRQSGDTLSADTFRIDTSRVRESAPAPYRLMMFQQYDSVQHISRSELIQENEIGIYFRYPLRKHEFRCLNVDTLRNWYLEEISANRDSVYLWIKQFPLDSLILEVSDGGKVVDTLDLSLTETKGKGKPGKKDQQITKRLMIKLNTQGRYLNYFKSDLLLTFSYPLSKYNLQSISLVDAEDTIMPKMEVADSLKRNFFVRYKWKEDKKYKLIIPDSSFFGLTGLTNDSLTLVFSTRAAKEFGFLKMNVTLQDTGTQVIVQMLNEKDQVLEQRIITAGGELKFEYLNPQKYKFKAIRDRNRNRRWDTGVYLKEIQPEEVLIYPKVIEIRANWEVQEDWNL